MALVATAAIPLVLIERQSRFESKARYHRSQVIRIVGRLECGPGVSRTVWLDSNTKEIPAARANRIIAANAWHGVMSWRYERAAARPWTILGPDPPEPK